MIQGVLERYRAAFNTLQASAVEDFWPGVDSKTLGRAFDRLDSQWFEFEPCEIRITGNRAVATCRGTATFVPKVGSRKPKTESRRWTFQLSRAADHWRIDSVVSQ